jgi:hypothetical protein
METNAMNLNDIRRLAGLKEQDDEDYTAPDVGDIIDHKELGKVKVVTDSDTYGGPAEYRVEVVLSHDQLVGAVALGEAAGADKAARFQRMTNDQYKELAGHIDQIDPTYVDYEVRLGFMNLYSALNDGYYGEITDKEDQKFNDLINELDDLVEKAAKQQGVEVPNSFGDDGVDIPNDIQREMETVIAKMKAVFIDKRSWTV